MTMMVDKKDGTSARLIKEGVIVKSAIYKHVWQREHSVTLEIKTRKQIDIERDDYVQYMGTRFYLHQDLKSIGTTSGSWQDIVVELYAPYMFLQRVQYKNVSIDQVRVRDDVPLTGNLYSLAQVIINNLNRAYGAGTWILGTYPADTLPSSFNFFYDSNCLFVVNELCEKYETYYTIEVVDNVFVLNFGAAISSFSHTLQYGLNAGLIDISLEAITSISRVTRLQVFGSTKNLAPGYRDYASNRLMLPPVYTHSEIEDSNIIQSHGISEGTIVNDDIFPHRTGTITSVVPGDIFSFSDSTMPGDINVSEGAQIAFLDGYLGGVVFDVVSYNEITKTFTIAELTDSAGFKKPNSAAAFQVSEGDRYTLLGIIMPKSYEVAAESELETWGLREYEKLQQAKVTLSLSTSSVYMRSINEEIHAGQDMHIVYQKADVDKNIRVSEVERDILNGVYTSIKLSDYSVKTPIRAIFKRISDIPSGNKGDSGNDSMFVQLGYYSQSIPCTNSGSTAASMLITIPFRAYQGTNRIACSCVAPAVGDTLVAGVTVLSVENATDNIDGSVVLTIAAGVNLGHDEIKAGFFDLAFKTFGDAIVTQRFGWTKALAGKDGLPGENGSPGKMFTMGMVHFQEEATSAPGKPSATNFSFATKIFNGLTAKWALGAPVYAAGNAKKYWYAYFTVEETTSGGGVGVPVFGDVAQAIGFSGLVTFTEDNAVSDGTKSLSFGSGGTTEIDGGNITTGTVAAKRIDVDNLVVKFLETVGDYRGYKVTIENSLNEEGEGASVISLSDGQGNYAEMLYSDEEGDKVPVVKVISALRHCGSKLYPLGLLTEAAASSDIGYDGFSIFAPYGTVIGTGTPAAGTVRLALFWDPKRGKSIIYNDLLPYLKADAALKELYRDSDGLNNPVIRHRTS